MKQANGAMPVSAAPGSAVPASAVPGRDVVFALLPNIVLLDLAGPADAFRNAESSVPGSYRLRFVAPEPWCRPPGD